MRCLHRHWFLMPSADLAAPCTSALGRSTPLQRRRQYEDQNRLRCRCRHRRARGRGTAVRARGSARQRRTDDFHMVRSSGAVAAGCLEDARARVTITQRGPVEVMDVTAWGLPAHREFDLFVTQVPDGPFGMSWYQGDMETNGTGARAAASSDDSTRRRSSSRRGRPTRPPRTTGYDASTNPATGPIHTFHLGLWFNSPRVAGRAGCPRTVTPFNGEHHAGSRHSARRSSLTRTDRSDRSADPGTGSAAVGSAGPAGWACRSR